jgi:flavin reductase (DIM6/NTAB) family NADH-FMN oxidoreductase RutF
MVNIEAFYQISYGLYLVCAGKTGNWNGYISNTVMQVTSEPARFAACCNKKNYTAGFIQLHKAFTVSILHEDAPQELIARFGYRSGRDSDKMTGSDVIPGQTGTPVVVTGSTGYLECRLTDTIDAGSHFIFIGELVSSGMLNADQTPMTYQYYRQTRKGSSPKNAPTYIDPAKAEKKAEKAGSRRFECPACGYVYDEEVEKVRFEDLPDDWVCPDCGTEKADFIEIHS